MRSTRRQLLVLASGSAVAASAASPAAASAPPGWTPAWVSMPQLTEPHNLPPAAFVRDGVVLPDTTLRQTVRVTAGGRSVRVRFSNAFGGADLPITAAAVARPLDGRAGVAAIEPGSSVPLTFSGRPSTVVPVGAQVVSDPVALGVRRLSQLTVDLYSRPGQASLSVTSHPGSRTTSHLLAGSHVGSGTLAGATPVDHWYFLSGVEVRGGPPAVVIAGDSLTDGRGSTTNGNDRWPDRLAELVEDVAVLNQAAGGNRVLRDGLGPNLLARLDRDVLAWRGVRWLIVFEGVNDLGTAAPADVDAVADDLIAAFRQIVVRAAPLRVYGATITPFGGNEGYDDPLRAAARTKVNTWIRTGGAFDAVLDFDAVVRDPAAPERLLPAYDTGDHLHLNPAGYAALARAVPRRLLR